MCEPRNRDNGASDVWALTAYTKSYVALTGRLPRAPRNSHVDPVTTALREGVTKA